jgi:hypothetical protein
MCVNLFGGIKDNPKGIASSRRRPYKKMLTRREVLTKLRTVGVRKLSWLKSACRKIEQYMAANYDYEIVKNRRPSSSKWINSKAR